MLSKSTRMSLRVLPPTVLSALAIGLHETHRSSFFWIALLVLYAVMAIELWGRGFSILLSDSRRTESGRLRTPSEPLVGGGIERSDDGAAEPGSTFKAAVTRVLLEVESGKPPAEQRITRMLRKANRQAHRPADTQQPWSGVTPTRTPPPPPRRGSCASSAGAPSSSCTGSLDSFALSVRRSSAAAEKRYVDHAEPEGAARI